MSDNYTEIDEQDEDDFKNLRAKAKKSDQFERENQSLKRTMAFMKAGIDVDDARMSYFVKGYDGDLDPQEIRTAAVTAGFMQAPQQETDPAVEQAQRGQQAAMAASIGSEQAADSAGMAYGMEQAYEEGGLEGLSAYAQQYGVTFNPESL